jgi:hypothetical protein
MVGQIGPLVQVGRKKTALGFHVLGGLTGGATLGVVLGFFGLLLAAALPGGTDTVFAIVVPAALVWAGLTDLGFLRLTYIERMRQTPGSWPCSLGHYPGMFAWGFDLGLGVTTRFPYQAVLVLPLAALLTGSLGAAIAVTAAYGAARGLAVAGAISAARGDIGSTCDAIQNRVGVLRRLVGATALLTAVLLLLA